MQQHLVHTQKIVIRSRGSGAARGLQHQVGGQQWVSEQQQRVSERFQQQLLREMQSLFDELAPPDTLLRIDSLHLDLGSLSSAGFEHEFITRFRESCRNAFLQSPDERVVHVSPVVTAAPLQSSFTNLVSFLEQGHLPWHSHVQTISFWEKELCVHFGSSEWEELLRWVRLRGRARPAVLQRLVYQFSDDFLQELLWNGLPGVADLTDEEYKKLRGVVRDRGWMHVLSVLSEDDNTDGFPALLTRLGASPANIPDMENGGHAKNGAAGSGGVNSKPSLANKEKEANISGKNSLEEAIYVENSGIILLHPFWEMYFAELGLLYDRQFRDEAAGCRAVLLLHWLATGSTEAAEFDLPLQKVLCGLPLDTPLPGRWELSPREQAESENLLRTMLGHWPPLQHSSMEGLRAGFFQRPGRLEEKEDHWLLTIEKKTIDLLLEKLPWGFSTIHLPWMEKTLLVEWC